MEFKPAKTVEQWRRRRDTHLNLARLLLLFQSRTRILTRHFGTELSFAESYVLAEIASGNALSIRELAGLLQLETSTVSRLVKGLDERGYIKRRSDASDGRTTRLALSAHGARALAADDQQRKHLLELEFAVLSAAERQTLQSGLSMLADCAGAPGTSVRKGEHHLRGEIKRITRQLGLLGSATLRGLGYLGTQLTSLQHQILFSVLERPFGVSIGDLARIIPFDQSSISRASQLLLSDRMLVRAETETQVVLRFSPRGYELFANELVRMRNFLHQILERSDQVLVQRLVETIAKFVNAPLCDGELQLVDHNELLDISSESARSAARTFFVEQSAISGWTRDISEHLFASDGNCFSLLHNKICVAVFDFQIEGDSLWLRNFAAEAQILLDPCLIGALGDAVDRTLHARGRRTCRVPAQSFALHTLRRFGLEVPVDEVASLQSDDIAAISPLRGRIATR